MNLPFSPARCLLKRQIQVISKIHSSRRTGSRPCATVKEISKNAGQIAETAAKEIPELEIPHEVIRRPPLADAGVTRRIVFFSLGIVGQDGIGFSEFAESCRCPGVLVLVRMALQRELPIGVLDLIAGRRPSHP
jgi:hypothetical protein